MKVLVLGGKGFLGSYVVKALLGSGDDVSTFDRSSGGKSHITGDINDSSTLKIFRNFDVVVNLVGLSPIKRYSSRQYEHVHVQGMRNIIAACEKYKVRRLVYVSALGVDKFPRTVYDKTKCEAEKLLKCSALEYSILRPSIVYEKDSDVFELFSKLSFGKFIIVPKLSNYIQPISATNFAYILSEEVDKTGNSLREIAGPDVFEFYDFFAKYYQGTGKNVVPVLSFFVRLVGVLARFVPILPLNKEINKYLAKDNILSLGTVKTKVGKTHMKDWLLTVG